VSGAPSGGPPRPCPAGERNCPASIHGFLTVRKLQSLAVFDAQGVRH
jgi:hypothetical protein